MINQGEDDGRRRRSYQRLDRTPQGNESTGPEGQWDPDAEQSVAKKPGTPQVPGLLAFWYRGLPQKRRSVKFEKVRNHLLQQ